MTRFLPHWPKATWALLIFTAWMILISATTTTMAPVVLWFVGLSVVVLLWLVSGTKLNVRIYGPGGKEWTVSAATAKRRVGNGWSYQPQPDPQP
jgi:hypothetical protein